MPRNPDEIRFAPVPRRSRRDGWTPDVQRAFIREMARAGGVTAAARAVGRSKRSAYTLLNHPLAGSFANAWSKALCRGREAVRDAAVERFVQGAVTPVTRQGREVGSVHRFDNRLATAILSGRDVDFERNRIDRDRERAWRNSDEMKAWREREEAAVAEAKRRALEAEARLRGWAEQERRPPPDPPRPRPRPEPRIRLL
jgi:hypothetical protein